MNDLSVSIIEEQYKDTFTTDEVIRDCEKSNNKIAMSGKAFDYMKEKFELENFRKILDHSIIFSRTVPR